MYLDKKNIGDLYQDDDYTMINQYYMGKTMYPNLPCYLQDENGEVFEFKWDLIYQYIEKLQDYEY